MISSTRPGICLWEATTCRLRASSEPSWRQPCGSSAPRMGVRVSPGDDLSALNQKFAQADVYTVIRRKQIEVGAGIRNNVDHGHFDQVTTADVEEMLASVQQFLGAELA